MRSTRGSPSHHPCGIIWGMFIWAPGPHPIWPGLDFNSLCFRPGQHGRRSSQNAQAPHGMVPEPKAAQVLGSGDSWQEWTGGEHSPWADIGHRLVQLTQRGGYIFWPCFPLSPTHRDREMDRMAWEDDGADRQARRRKRRGGVSSWSGLLRIHLTRR